MTSQDLNTELGRPVRILLVEDSPSDRAMTIDAFQEGPIANVVHAVADGEQAMAYLRHEEPYSGAVRPDVILLDLNLPRKDGREVLADIKGDPRLRSIPVVILTTSSAEADVLRAYDMHANAYVTKPVDYDKFLEAIRGIEGFWLSLVRLLGPA
jgi:CheY-like chemotaxis protein